MRVLCSIYYENDTILATNHSLLGVILSRTSKALSLKFNCSYSTTMTLVNAQNLRLMLDLYELYIRTVL